MIVIEEIQYYRIEELLKILRERALWLESINQPMWNTKFLTKELFIEKYNNPKCFLVKDKNITIGGFILLEKDDVFWSEADDENVFYIHKLVVDLKYKNCGYSREILKKIIEYSKENNKKYLRLDYYSDRKVLKNLYKEIGFIEKERLVMPDKIEISKCELCI